MNFLKLFLILVTVSAFILSCGQAATTPNVKNTAPNSAPANATSNSAASNAAAGNSPVKKSQLISSAVDIDEGTPNLYAEKCMVCHKDTGKGGKITIQGKAMNPIDLTSAKVKARSDEKLLAEIKDGVPEEGMPSFSNELSDDQIKTIVSHIRTLK